MQFNNYNLYSKNVKSEVNTNTTEEIVTDLKNFNQATEVQAWLRRNWNIKNSISNFSINNSLLLSVKFSRHYLNITIKHKNKVYSFNYNRGEI